LSDRAIEIVAAEMIDGYFKSMFHHGLMICQPVGRFARKIAGGIQIPPGSFQFSHFGSQDRSRSHLHRDLREQLLSGEIGRQVPFLQQSRGILQPSLFQGDLRFLEFEPPGLKHANRYAMQKTSPTWLVEDQTGDW
jgi:hypothetical protein